MSNKPFVTIIIPVRNAERTLETTFEYLMKVNYPRDRMEIIIADGDSTDGTLDMIKKWQKNYPFISFVQIPNCKSPGDARNAAIKNAKGDYLCFTDGDCAPNPDWIDQLLLPFSIDPKIGGVGGEILTLRTDPNNDTESYCEQVGFLSVKGRFSIKEEGMMPTLSDLHPSQVSAGRAPFFATANVCFKKEAVHAVGGTFWHHPTGEDVEFSIRIQLAGYKLYYAPKAVVNHMHRVSMEAFNKQWVGYGRGHSYIVQKHSPNVMEIIFQSIPGSPRIAIPFPVKGLIHIGNYQNIQISLWLALFFGFGGLLQLTDLNGFFITLGFLLYFIYVYFKPVLNLKPRSKFLTWCKIRYLTNKAFIKGGLIGTKETGILYIEPSW